MIGNHSPLHSLSQEINYW